MWGRAATPFSVNSSAGGRTRRNRKSTFCEEAVASPRKAFLSLRSSSFGSSGKSPGKIAASVSPSKFLLLLPHRQQEHQGHREVVGVLAVSPLPLGSREQRQEPQRRHALRQAQPLPSH